MNNTPKKKGERRAPWFSVPEAAEALGVSRQSLQTRVTRGNVPSVATAGGRVQLIAAAWVDAQKKIKKT